MSEPQPSASGQDSSTAPARVTRRQAMRLATGATVAGAALALTATPGTACADKTASDDPQGNDGKVVNGRIRQSVMAWCFKPMPVEELAKHCKEIGLVAMEGCDPKHYPMLKEMGLDVSLVSSHGFKRGMCDPTYHDECAKILRQRIDLAAEAGYKNVITFTGMRVDGLDDQQMTKHCVDGWKKVIKHAENKKVNLCLEHLNSRDDSHPMKGHPGYFGDDVDHCVRMIEQVGSPRMKLLFDIYHVQIMNGDVIRRIGQYKDYIAHYHTAGVPGRGELDETQELNYPAVMKAILATGFEGYVAQEFLPTWDDPVAALRHAAQTCDV